MTTEEKNVLVAGCSFTKGLGLVDEENNPRLWVNQLFNDIAGVKNISTNGWNNESIFHAVSVELLQKDYDIVLVCWSTIPRYNFNVGLEWYSTRTSLEEPHTINVNPGKIFTKKKLSKIKHQLLELHNDHWDILKMVQYVNILINLQVKLKNKKIYFVNGIGPWENNFFRKKDWSFPSELDDYTKFLLSTDTRDDNEIKTLYNKIHCDYHCSGGIQEKYWLNLYNSLDNLKIDTAPSTNWHPGYKSQDLFVKTLEPVLTKLIGRDNKIHKTTNFSDT